MSKFMEKMQKDHGDFVEAENHLWIFEDGFKLRGSDGRGDLYQMIEPEDDLAKLRAQREYFETKLDKEVHAWESFKNDCLNQAKLHLNSPAFCPGPPSDAVAQLEWGKARIKVLQTALARIEKQLPELSDQYEQEELNRSRYADAVQRHNEIAAVEL